MSSQNPPPSDEGLASRPRPNRSSSRAAPTFGEVLAAATPRVWVTPAIVGVNVVVFVAMVATAFHRRRQTTGELFKWGADYRASDRPRGPWWRAITAAFLHVGALHLSFNTYAFFSAGAIAERVYGKAAFLALYVVAAVAGSLVSILWTPTVVSAGASGAVFGVYGAILAFALTRGARLFRRRELEALRNSIWASSPTTFSTA